MALLSQPFFRLSREKGLFASLCNVSLVSEEEEEEEKKATKGEIAIEQRPSDPILFYLLSSALLCLVRTVAFSKVNE